MRAPIYIRELRLHDLDEYIRLRQEGVRVDPVAFGRAYANERLVTRAAYAVFLAPSVDRVIWGAFHKDRLVGMIRLEGSETSAERTIYSVYVCPVERNRGLGQRLLDVAVQRAKRSFHCRQILLNVETSNMAALAMYRAAGFREFKVEQDAYSIGGRSYSEYSMMKCIATEQNEYPDRRQTNRSTKYAALSR